MGENRDSALDEELDRLRQPCAPFEFDHVRARPHQPHRILIRRLGMENRTTIIHERAEAVEFQSNDVVICASLLEAPGLYDALAKHGVKTIIVRDTEGLFRLCYKPATEPATGYCPGGRTLACSSRINISRLFSLTDGL